MKFVEIKIFLIIILSLDRLNVRNGTCVTTVQAIDKAGEKTKISGEFSSQFNSHTMNNVQTVLSHREALRSLKSDVCSVVKYWKQKFF